MFQNSDAILNRAFLRILSVSLVKRIGGFLLEVVMGFLRSVECLEEAGLDAFSLFDRILHLIL